MHDPNSPDPTASTTPPSTPPENRFARAVTEILAPTNLVIVLLLGVGWHSTGSVAGLGWGALAALFCGVLPLAFVMLGVRRGKWTDKHVKRREQRAVPLSAGIASVIVGLVLLQVLNAPTEVFALVVAMLGGLVAVLAVTVVWKISAHTAVAGGTVAILVSIFGPMLLPATLAVALVAWSRVSLRDHTPAQVLAGAAVGATVAAVLFDMLR